MARNFVAASSQLLLTSATPVTAAALTLACWFKPVSATVSYSLVSIDDGSANERFALLGNTNGTIRVASVHLGAAFVNATTATYSVGVWSHACATFSTAPLQCAYVNGTPQAGGGASSVKVPSGVAKVRIGATAGGVSFMNGDLAEVAVWNVALTAADVVVLAAGVSPLLVRRDALVGYWPLRHGYSPEIDLMSTRTAVVTGATVVAHPRVLLPRPWLVVDNTVVVPPSPPPPPDGPISPTFVDKHGPTHRWLKRKRLANEETTAERQARELRERVALGILPAEQKPTVAPALRARVAETEVIAREADADAQAVTAEIEAWAREVAQQYAAESRRQAAQIAAALEAFEQDEEDAIAAILTAI